MPVDPKVAELVDLLWNDPETHDDVAALIEKKAPGAIERTRQIKTVETLRDELAKDRQERAKWKEEEEKAKRERAWEDERRRVVALGLCTEEDLPEIEKLMVGELIGKLDVAAKLYRQQQHVAAPRPSTAGRLLVPGLNGAGGDEFKGLFARDATERDRWASDRARQILDDFAHNQGTKWLS